MDSSNLSPARLYLLKLSETALPLGSGKSLELVLGCYLVETRGGKHILIDSGIAADGKSPDSPAARDETDVLQQLAMLGKTPDDIDIVLCTHFDVDHAGYHDSFPRAEFIVQRRHYELAKSGHPRFSAARAHWDHPDLRYRLIDGDTELAPGLTLLETSGHAPGHQSVLLHLPHTGAVLLVIDAVMMKQLFTPDRRAWPNDDNEAQLRASTVKLLEVVEREQAALVVFGHDGLQWQNLKTSPAFYD